MPDNPNRLIRFWKELKHRKVIHVIVVYATASFVIIELVNNVYEPLKLPDWTPLLFIIFLTVGFPFAIVISWIFDISLKGVRKTEAIDNKGITEHRSLSTEAPNTTEKSIIVLPFENISPDPDQEYFSDGLTEEIITDLSHIHNMLVISRSSAMTYKGTRKKVKEIADEVNVQYVLEGSVRKEQNNLKITAQLIDGTNDTHLWAEKYTGTIDDIFNIQEQVSRLIVKSLEIKLTSEEEALVKKQKIQDTTAYEQYLLARHEIWRANKESLGHAIQLLRSSLKAIGENEYLLTALGYVYFQYVNLGIDPDEKHLDTAEELVNEALKCNPILSKAHFIKSLIHETRGNLHESFIAIKKALEFDPNDSEALLMMAFIYAIVGKPEKGKPFASRAIEVDPFSSLAYIGEWWVSQSSGDFEKALEACSKMYKLDTDNPMSLYAYAYIQACNKNIRMSIELFDLMVVKHPDHPLSLLGMALRHAINNDKDEARQMINEQLIKAAEMDHIFAWWLADVYASINEKSKAVEYLERASRDIFIDYPFFSKYDPFLENLRGDELFEELMKRVKVKWTNFEI